MRKNEKYGNLSWKMLLPIHRFPLWMISTAVAVFAHLLTAPSFADRVLPPPVTDATFADLKALSPFRRSIDYSDSLVLTGMARIEGNVYATLFDAESTKSHVVSERMNPAGWQLVDVQGDEDDLESLTAKIQVNGGEVFAIRYQKTEFKPSQSSSSGTGVADGASPLSQEQIDDAKRAARDPSQGFRGDGYRGPPPPEILEKLNQITPQQREQLARRVMQMRNNGVESEVRTRFYNDALNRAIQQGGR